VKPEDQMGKGQPVQLQSASLGAYQAGVEAALAKMSDQRLVARIWEHDHTVWKQEPTDILNRLGWLHIAETISAEVASLTAWRDAVAAEGYTDVLLLGMGGSSLAPDVYSRVFGSADSPLRLAVLDSTDPAAVLFHAERLDPARTLFIVATKSGSTAETLSFFKFFYNWMLDALGRERVGEHFVAITDPGSKLADLAQRYAFRQTFLNDPHIGGRYSALSYFGLVPAVLAGVDIGTLLARAGEMARRCRAGIAKGDSEAAWLGAVLAELALAGRDKLTLVLSPGLANFGDWIEQLIAESTGKEGRGILPVVGEPLGAPEVYGADRLFVYLQLEDDNTYDEPLQALEAAGQPVVRLVLADRYDLGGQFFLWEFATAVAGARLGINPFDQPDVEAAKILARQAITAYGETGALPPDVPAPLNADSLREFLAQARAGDYVALQAYVQPTAETDSALLELPVHSRRPARRAHS